MAYQARRNDDDYDASQSYSEQKKAEDEKNSKNNANTIRNAAKVAEASGEGHAVAIGKAINAADKLTGGKSTDMLGKAMTRANKFNPGGRQLQKASNKLAESGMGDKIGQAASMAGGDPSKAGSKAGDTASKASDASSKIGEGAGPQKAKEGLNQQGQDAAEKSQKIKKSESSEKGEQDSSPSSSDDTGESKKGIGRFLVRQMIITIVMSIAPFFVLVIALFALIANITSIFSDYDDAFGMSSTIGEETGGIEFNPSSKKQQDFLKRIEKVQKEYQSQGKYFDSMKIVAIYHALVSFNVSLDYNKVKENVIRQWADSMLSNNYYDEEVFRYNLVNNIFPNYKPKQDKDYYENMADEVFDYLERYYDLIGKDMSGTYCTTMGSCSYNIKGFAIPGRGNAIQNIQVSNLKVRLMECGSPYGNGNYNTPIKQELVDFEDYIAGVAYAEIGPNASEELLKVQMVVARSFALSRPASLGNANGKKLTKENGQWILQISSCVADQVFCNIDLGCSYMGGGDGQGGICRSGSVPGAVKTRAALPKNHAIRRAAAETQGEVLVNSMGYIINTPYLAADQQKWASLAKQGLNYKQILIQSYNSGSRNYGATNIAKASCKDTGTNNCISTGEFSNWKQGNPQWAGTSMGSSGKNLGQIGCLVTSVSMLIAKSKVPVNINPFNPGTFVEFLNKHGGIDAGGNFQWAGATQAAPSFRYQGKVDVSGMDYQSKLNKIKEIVNQPGVYAVAEVKGNTGQHWVAIDGVNGSTINMMDPSSNSKNMWAQYNWANTSTIAYYRVV